MFSSLFVQLYTKHNVDDGIILAAQQVCTCRVTVSVRVVGIDEALGAAVALILYCFPLQAFAADSDVIHLLDEVQRLLRG